MSDHKHKTQAQKASASKSSSKKQNAKSASKKDPPKKEAQKERAPSLLSRIPIRFLSSAIFLILFVVFLVIFLGPEGALTSLIEDLVLGFVGTVGYVVSIPAFLYLFFIHAFIYLLNLSIQFWLCTFSAKQLLEQALLLRWIY